MRERKIISVLRLLSKKELSDFTKFLANPQFNKDEKLSLLFSVLKKGHPQYDELFLLGLNTSKPFSRFFGQAIDAKELNKMFSYLLQKLEDFQFQGLQKSSPIFSLQKEFTLLKFYNANGLNTLFKQKLRACRKLIGERKVDETDFYYLNFQIEKEVSQFEAKQDDRIGDINMVSESKALDEFFLVNKLLQLCLAVNRARTLGLNYHLSLKQELIDYIPTSDHLKNPQIELWFNALLLLENGGKKHYQNLQTLLEKNAKILAQDKARALFVFLENEARRIDWGSISERYQQMYLLYLGQLKENLFFFNGYMMPQTFKNIVTVSLRLGKIEAAEKFVSNYHSKVLPPFREDVHLFSLCQILFEKGKYDLVLESLREVSLKDLFYSLGAKRLQAMTYCAIEEFELLENYLNTFRVFVFRKKPEMSQAQFEAHQNFINALSGICQWKQMPQNRTEGKVKLEEKVDGMRYLSERQWIMKIIQ